MKVTYERDRNRLTIDSFVFTATNNVRNEIDPIYVRRLHDPREVRYTITKDRSRGKPYMPRKFPKGVCEITAVEHRSDFKFDAHEFGQVRVRTNATQAVEVWALDNAGGYDHPTGEFVPDYGYLIHYSDFNTTLGCIRASSQETMIKIADLIEAGLREGKVFMNVI